MPKKANSAKSSTPSLKKSLKKLFEERDRTRPGSSEEEQTAEAILEAVFPDSTRH
jgi:hypothetical protein